MGTSKPTVLLLMYCYMWNKLCLNQIIGGVKGLMIVSEWLNEQMGEGVDGSNRRVNTLLSDCKRRMSRWGTWRGVRGEVWEARRAGEGESMGD